MTSRRGLTLLEVLLASALLAGIVAAVALAAHALLRAASLTRELRHTRAAAELALDTIAPALASASDPNWLRTGVSPALRWVALESEPPHAAPPVLRLHALGLREGRFTHASLPAEETLGQLPAALDDPTFAAWERYPLSEGAILLPRVREFAVELLPGAVRLTLLAETPQGPTVTVMREVALVAEGRSAFVDGS